MNKNCQILLLDNDPFRHEMFGAAAGEALLHSTYEVKTFEAALNESCVPDLVCLDHDLGCIYNDEVRFPNTCGCDAADVVVELVPEYVPVLIHSSNARCARIMRHILLNAGRRGRVAIVNTSTVSAHSDQAGVQALREAMDELLATPTWHEDLSKEVLLEVFGEASQLLCSIRSIRRKV